MVRIVRERELIDTPIPEPSNPSEEVKRFPEPEAILLISNGKGGFRGEKKFLSEIETEILVALEKEDELKEKLDGAGKRLADLKKRKHGSGRLRSKRERTDIEDTLRKARAKLKGRLVGVKTNVKFLERAQFLVQTSTPEMPLKIKQVAEGKIEVFIDSRQLSAEEVEWREFIGEYAPTLWRHPKRELLTEAYFLQRDAHEEWQNQGLEGPKQAKWKQFVSEHMEEFPEEDDLEEGEIALLMARIAERFERYTGPRRRRPRRFSR